MDWMDRETMNRQAASYNAAYNKILEICPKVEAAGNQGIFPVEFRPITWHWDKKELIGAATNIIVGSFDLVESPFFRGKSFVKPNVGPGSDLWNYNFFHVSFAFDSKMERFRWRPGTIGEGGTRVEEERIVADYSTRIRLSGAEAKWGLGSWYKKAKEIQHYADEAGVEIRQQYAAAYQKASAEVKKWEELVQVPKEVPTIPKLEHPNPKVEDARYVRENKG